MNFKELVNERYSCKSYSSKKVEEEKILEILQIARHAPTAKNLQEQHIYVLQSEEALGKVDEVTRCRYNAQTVLCVAFDKNNVYTYPGEKRNSGLEDASIVATHLMLACKELGLESCWLNAFDPNKLHELLGLPENEEILMLLDVGYPGDNAGPLDNHFKRKEVKEFTTFI